MPLSRRRALSLTVGGGLALVAGPWLTGGEPAPAAPAPANPRRGSWRLGLISDLNGSYGSTTYVPEVGRGVNLLLQLRPDLVLCAGDMVAGQKLSLSDQQLEAMWAAFAAQVVDPLRRAGLPFAPVIGNHDASAARRSGSFVFERERRLARRFWHARRDQLGLRLLDGPDFPFHYSVRQGDVLLIVIDASAAQLAPGTLQWLERQLQAEAARSAAVRLVVGHLPLAAVSQGRDRPGEVLADPGRLQALLLRHRATLYISGHHHAYYPGRSGRLDLLSLGAMGSGPRRLLAGSRPPHQSLTVLDRFGDELVDTTFDLTRGLPLDPGQLPARLQPAQGLPLSRRPARWRIP